MNYSIIKINVYELMRMRYGNGIDLTDPVVYQSVAQVIAKPDNAAFYQMIEVNQEGHENGHALIKYIVQMDLSGVGFFGEDIRKMLDEGIAIRFGFGECLKKFVAYDKSNSMARAKQIYFVREDIRDALHKRLMLDIGGIKVSNSKLYSYRGLYYSDSVRIEDENLVLNEERVIVINDCYVKKPGEGVFTAKKSDTKKDGNRVIKYDFVEDRLTEEDFFNQFDGEGIISPKYAEIISRCLGKKVNSFQIRLPFGKGMLHSVDWKAMLTEMAEKNGRLIDLNRIYICDAFGQRRCLGDAEIILTRSMMKCEKWLGRFCKGSNTADYMKYYFDKFNEYSHALYISGEDSNIRNTGLVRFTYQFLNPMAMSDDRFNNILKKHCDIIDGLDFSRIASNVRVGVEIPELELIGGPEPSEDNGEDILSARLGMIKCTEPWAKVLKKYPRFIKDRYVKEKVGDFKNSLIKQIAEGQIYVGGELRYLSGDLFYFMIHLCRIVNKEQEQLFTIQPLAGHAIPENCVYLPGFSNTEGDVALFRNPHLSRNEECAAHIFKTDDENGFFKYFRHLNKVVMLSYKSLNAVALGGADFDGDEIKVITDSDIVNAVKKGIYGGSNVFRNREEPIIKIPSLNSPESELSAKVDPETVINTFDSRIGLISNSAIIIGLKEYYGDAEEKSRYKNGCAKCTILTGLEIDAAKTGEHPDLTVLTDAANNRGNNIKICIDPERDYIKLMNLLMKVKPWKITGKEDGTFKVEGRKNKTEIKKYGANAPNILKLLYKYCEVLCKSRDSQNSFAASDNIVELFYGDGYPDRMPQENREKTEKLKIIIRDYKAIQQLFKENRKQDGNGSGDKFFSHVRFNHDSLDGAFSCSTYKTARDVANEAIVTMEQCLKSRKMAKEALDKIKLSKWIMTPECKRKEKLFDILNIEDGYGPSLEVIELLTDFRNRGYDGLGYCIEYAKNNLPEDEETYAKYRDNCFYDLCMDCMKQNMEAGLWKARLNAAAREKVANITNCSPDDLSEAVEFVLPCRGRKQGDFDGEFFWNIFTEKEIIANVR